MYFCLGPDTTVCVTLENGRGKENLFFFLSTSIGSKYPSHGIVFAVELHTFYKKLVYLSDSLRYSIEIVWCRV